MAKAAIVIFLGCWLLVGCGGGGPTIPPESIGQLPSPSTQPGSSASSASGGGEAAAGSWTVGQDQAGAGSTLLDCATATFCVAGGYVWDGSSFSPIGAPDTGPPDILDCASATECSAISDDQYAVWNGSAWTTSKNFFQDGGEQGGVSIDSMSCPSATFCAAADETYGYVYLFDGTSWTTDKTTVDQAVADATAAVNAGRPGNVLFNTIACSSATFCALVDGAGNVRTFDGKTWAPSVSIASKATEDTPFVDCPGSGFCLASVNGAISVWDGSAWHAAGDVPAFSAASCATTSFCMLVGANTVASDWATYDGKHVAIGSGKTGIQQPWAVSCPTPDLCLATGPYGFATWKAD